MANTDNPNGFQPYMAADSQPKVTYLNLAAANSKIELHDPVTIASGDVDKAAASNALCGIAAEYKAASSGGLIAVYAEPEQLFVAQTDNGTGTLTAATDVGKNANFVAGAGTSALNRSTSEIDENSGDVTATLPFKVIRLSDEASNAHGQFNRLVVKINNHQFSSGTGTLGS